MSEVIAETRGHAGLITLNRPKALNALSLEMIRDMTRALLAWRDDDAVEFVAVRGQGREGPFGAFCAGGDIRFFHAAALSGDPRLEDFFTEEYTLNHIVQTYPKPYVTLLDGVVMGGGMGISGHGREAPTLRIVTERTKMAMPETNIGLFPDVGGGWFLSRCPGRLGEYLALTGEVIGGADAVALGLADAMVPSSSLPGYWESMHSAAPVKPDGRGSDPSPGLLAHRQAIDAFFALDSVAAIVAALEADTTEFATRTAAVLRKRSPLMLHVVLEQVRRARTMSFANELRMERDIVRNCFHVRPGAASETVEGIRALAVDKDHQPKWNPARVEDVAPTQWQAYFQSPWPGHAHPLRGLA